MEVPFDPAVSRFSVRAESSKMHVVFDILGWPNGMEVGFSLMFALAGFKTKKPSSFEPGYGIGRRPTLPPVGQYHRRGRA